MTIVKRLLGILAALFIGAVVLLFLVFPQVVNQIADITGNMGRSGDQPYETGKALLHWAIALVIDLPILWFVILRPFLGLFRRTRDGKGLVVQKGQGLAYMDRESVRQQVYAAVIKIRDIERVEVSIENDKGRANILVNILTQNTISGPQKKQEIRREIRKVVEDQLGIRISGEPTINISLTPIPGEVPQAVPGMSPEAGRPTTAAPVARPAATIKPLREPEPAPAPRPAPARIMPEPIKEPEKLEAVPPANQNGSPVFSRRTFVPQNKTSGLEDLVPKMPDAPVAEKSDAPAEPTSTLPPPDSGEQKEDKKEPVQPPMTE